jgi:hypothetical protein
MSQDNSNGGRNQSLPSGILSILSLFALIFAPFIMLYNALCKIVADGRRAYDGGSWSFSKWLGWFTVDSLMYMLSLVFLFFIPLPFFGPLSRAYTGGYSRGRKKYGFSGYDRWCLMGWLVVTGWVVHLVGKANGSLQAYTGMAIDESTLAWAWLGVIIFTFIVLIEDFPKERMIRLMLFGSLVGMIIAFDFVVRGYIYQSKPFVVKAIETSRRIDVVVEWGFPMVLSIVFGGIFVMKAVFYKVANHIHFTNRSNMFEYRNLLEKSESHEKQYMPPKVEITCWLKYLFFGVAPMQFGDPGTPRSVKLVLVPLPFTKKHKVNKWLATTDVTLVDNRTNASGTPPQQPDAPTNETVQTPVASTASSTTE